MANPRLSRRAVVLGKIETTYNTDPTPTPTADAFLVMDPKFSVDANTLQRENVRNDLSPMPHRVGRKLAKLSFGVEFRSNGSTNGGTLSDAAKLGRLLRACGYSETAVSGTGTVGAVTADPDNTGATVSWAAGGESTYTQKVTYTIAVTTGGASGTAEVSITPDADAVAASVDTAQTGVVVTSGSAINLKNGGGGATLTPTWSSDLDVGDTFTVVVSPVGIKYDPISTGIESMTFYHYEDGLLYKLTGCIGTFSLTANAGEYATAQFEFTGQYIAPSDASLPTTGVYESNTPPVVELARLKVDGFAAVVKAFTFEQNNTISPREDVNNSDGYNGVRLVNRDPQGGIDPEATVVADYNWWTKFAASTQVEFKMRLGQDAGNMIWVYAPGVQYTGMTFGDRDGIRTYDAGLKFARSSGNDEIQFYMV